MIWAEIEMWTPMKRMVKRVEEQGIKRGSWKDPTMFKG